MLFFVIYQPVKIISLPESDIDTQENLKTTGECENELRILYRPRGMDILSVHNGENSWRHTLPGGSLHDFLTVGHFWVDWLWFAAQTLETHRKDTLLFQEFCRRHSAGRVALLHEIQAYHYAQGSLEVSELLAGQVITPDTLSPYQGDFSRALAFPENSNDCYWASVLLTALSLPIKGAAFYYGHSCARAWAVDPEAMKTYEDSRYGRTLPLNENASLACSN